MAKPKDNQDIERWVKWHTQKTRNFIAKVAPLYGINGVWNQGKREDRYTIDMIINGGTPAELLITNIPFYLAGWKGVRPEYAVCVNVRQVEALSRLEYPTLLLFWIDFPDSEAFGKAIVGGTWVYWNWHHKFIKLIESRKPQIHQYKERREDAGENAEASYLIDIRDYAIALPRREPVVFSMSAEESDTHEGTKLE